MALMAMCGVLVVAGLAMIALWGDQAVRAPLEPPADAGAAAWRFAWYATLAIAAGCGGGILVAGAGGRLVMRALAVTADDRAQGRITEAEEVVGDITADGTIGFILFVGLAFGFVTGAVYLLVRHWLPAGRLRGLAYGALLLVLLGTRLDPLRPGNPDFDLVGPGWLSVLLFGLLALAQGAVVAAIAGRYSRALPVRPTSLRELLRYWPVLLLVPFLPALAVLLVAGVVSVVVSRLSPRPEGPPSERFVRAGRIVLVVIVLVALPWFVMDVADIATR